MFGWLRNRKARQAYLSGEPGDRARAMTQLLKHGSHDDLERIILVVTPITTLSRDSMIILAQRLRDGTLSSLQVEMRLRDALTRGGNVDVDRLLFPFRTSNPPVPGDGVSPESQCRYCGRIYSYKLTNGLKLCSIHVVGHEHLVVNRDQYARQPEDRRPTFEELDTNFQRNMDAGLIASLGAHDTPAHAPVHHHTDHHPSPSSHIDHCSPSYDPGPSHDSGSSGGCDTGGGHSHD